MKTKSIIPTLQKRFQLRTLLFSIFVLVLSNQNSHAQNQLNKLDKNFVTEIIYEAEDAELAGVTVANSLAGFSGTGYMDGGSFDNDSDKITFTFSVEKAGLYPLSIRFQNTCGACEKAQFVSINDDPEKYTAFLGSGSQWENMEVGDVELNAGENTVVISKSWGWTHIDYIIIGAKDEKPPTAPTNTAALEITQTSFKLTWDAASDNVEVQGYYLFFDGALKDSTENTQIEIEALSCETEYVNILVKAFDKVWNVSEESETISVKTKACMEYSLTVNSGSGSGSYLSGTTVQIKAVAAPAGKIFEKWSGSGSVENIALSETTIKMPEEDTEITATYKDIDQTPLLDPNATAETVALWNYLKSIYKQKMLTGCWTESQFGGNDNVEKCTGKTPALWGQDMNSWYRNRTEQNWINTWNNNIAGFKNAHERGQILQVNWHWQMVSSKVNGVYTRDAWGRNSTGGVEMMSEQEWEAIVTPGTDLYKAMLEDIDYHVQNFLKKIVDDNGNPIPIIFRPLHEIDGGWFWWTCKTDPTKTAELFRIIYDRILKHHQCHNLIWVYNPGIICNGNNWPPFEPSGLTRRKAYYPGDEYCDITGIDLYEYDPAGRATYANTGKTYRDAWDMMQQIAPDKMIALCESEGMPDANKSFTDPDYAPWLYCLPWFSERYKDGISGKTRDLCEWNEVQFKSNYVVNAGDFIITETKPDFLFEKTEINFYPNPVLDGNLTFQKSPDLNGEKEQITLFDLFGRIVQQEQISNSTNQFNIHLINIPKGVYVLAYQNSNFRTTQKIIVQ